MKYKFICFLIIIIGMFSCNLDNIAPQKTPENVVPANKGVIMINIPRIAQSLQDMLDSTAKPLKSDTKNDTASRAAEAPDKAMIIADRVEITLYDSNSTPIDAWSITQQSTIGTNSSRIVSPGINYSLHVDIYNIQVSTTQPVVSGNSAIFDAVAGQVTNVSVICLPNSTVNVAESTTYSGNLLTGIYEFAAGITDFGAEAYYRITPSTSMTRINLIPNGLLIAYALFFDNMGMGLVQAYNAATGPGTPVSLTYATTPGATYYVGVVLFAESTQIMASFDLSYAPFIVPTDPYEPNDSTVTAHTLIAGTPLSNPLGYGVLAEGDSDYFTFNATSATDLLLTLDVTMISSVAASDSVYFDIYDSSMTYLTYAYLNWVGTDSITYLLPGTGTYYIIAYGADAGNCVEYDLQWSVADTSSYYYIETFPNGGGSGADPYMYLYDSSLNQLTSDDDSGSGYYSLITHTLQPGATYYIQVYDYYNTTGYYSLMLSQAGGGSSTATPLTTAGEPDNADTEAFTINLNTVYDRYLDMGESDWFVITIP